MRSALLMILAVIAFNIAAFTQASFPSTETLQANIRGAVERNESSGQLGTHWLALANRYQDRFELGKAEDAYARATHLLRDTSSQNEYAESLHGMGNVYRSSARLKEAGKCLKKSLEIYERLNDDANIAHLHVALGLELLAENKYRKAEAESTAALKYFESGAKPDVSDMSAHLIRSRILAARDAAAPRSRICRRPIP